MSSILTDDPKSLITSMVSLVERLTRERRVELSLTEGLTAEPTVEPSGHPFYISAEDEKSGLAPACYLSNSIANSLSELPQHERLLDLTSNVYTLQEKALKMPNDERFLALSRQLEEADVGMAPAITQLFKEGEREFSHVFLYITYNRQDRLLIEYFCGWNSDGNRCRNDDYLLFKPLGRIHAFDD